MSLALKDKSSDAGLRREAAAEKMFAETSHGEQWSELPESVRMAYRRAVTERVSPLLCIKCGRNGDAHQGGHLSLCIFQSAPRTTAT